MPPDIAAARERVLSSDDARLLVVGYGFGDEHVNRALVSALPRGLRLVIVDPLPPAKFRRRLRSKGVAELWQAVVGYFDRSVRETFGEKDRDRLRSGEALQIRDCFWR